MKGLMITAVVFFMMALVAVPAHATYVCQGTVTNLGVGSNGVAVSGPGGLPSIFLCKVDGTSANGFTPDVCKAAYAMLLSAKLNGQTVTIEFNDNLTCATQPAWTPSSSAIWVSTP